MPHIDSQRFVETLDRVFGEIDRHGDLALAGELHELCKAAEAEPDAARADGLRRTALDKIAGLAPERVSAVLRYITARFHLLNKAEQLEIADINRSREAESTPEKPRPESIADAVRRVMTGEGGGPALDTEGLVGLLGRLDIAPTMTAHPTEARRRSILSKQQEAAVVVERMRDPRLTPAERRALESRLRQLVRLLIMTDEVRHKRLDVPDEVRNGLYFLTTSIWDAVPRIHRDIADAIEQLEGPEAAADAAARLPAFLSYRSWIGGDRDGNPKVTHRVTEHTLKTLRAAAVERYDEALMALRHELSPSANHCAVPPGLKDAIERDGNELIDDPDYLEHVRFEPLRLRVMQIRAKLLKDPGYTAAAFVADIEQLRSAVREAGLAETADRGPLAALSVCARTVGLRLATLDVRQHSRVHEEVVAELLSAAKVHADYRSLDEDGKLAVLHAELNQPRPLSPRGVGLSETAEELLGTMRVVAGAIKKDADAVTCWIISMTHDVSDLLEVLLLMKEAGLHRVLPGDGAVESDLDVVPLFETIDDLHRAPVLLTAMLEDPVFRRHLESRAAASATKGAAATDPAGAGLFQEIMLGYSDSNKDGGFLMANTALHRAMAELSALGEKHDVDLRFFHGRGGTVGRGGGRANRAILANPLASHNGRIRFTEQGEVISFRYALPDIARRHTEQIVSAMIVSTHARDGHAGGSRDGEAERVLALLEPLADKAMAAYRALIDDPGFFEWFADVSPIRFIGGLPIASRPVSRAKGGALDFENLRAIPWVFAWIQMRYTCPGWYGLGTALGQGDLAALKEAYQTNAFARAILNNAQQEMARARLPLAACYTADGNAGRRFHETITQEFAAARAAMLEITDQAELLDNEPAIQQAIKDRNPYTDVLQLVQIDLLRRAREADPGPTGDPTRDALRPVMFASINALAAAMQSTG